MTLAVSQPRRRPRARRVLSDHFDPRLNSLNALRLLLATLVLVSHGIKFSGHDDPLGTLTGVVPRTGTGVDIGTVAVDGFFVLSGFLITASYLRTSSLPRYLWHRALRILPGFWACLIVTALVFAPLLSLVEHGRLGDYAVTGPDSATSFVTTNAGLLMRQFHIEGLAGGESLNGSLHTLFFEFLCYLVVAGLGALAVLRTRPVLVPVLAAVVWLVAVLDAGTGGLLTAGVEDGIGRELLLRFLLMFLAGAVLHLYAASVPVGPTTLALAGLVLVASLVWPEVYLLLAPLPLGLLLLTAGSSPALARVGRTRDLSYGLYVYAWPVQVLLLALGVAATGLLVYLALSLAVGLGLAMLSWRFVEAPGLSAKAWTPRFLLERGRSAGAA